MNAIINNRDLWWKIDFEDEFYDVEARYLKIWDTFFIQRDRENWKWKQVDGPGELNENINDASTVS